MTPVTHCHSAGRTSLPQHCSSSHSVQRQLPQVHLPEVKPLKEDNNKPALSISAELCLGLGVALPSEPHHFWKLPKAASVSQWCLKIGGCNQGRMMRRDDGALYSHLTCSYAVSAFAEITRASHWSS